MAQGIRYNIKGKYDPKGEKDAIKGLGNIKKSVEKMQEGFNNLKNTLIGGFVIDKVFEGFHKVIDGATEEFKNNTIAISNFNKSMANNANMTAESIERVRSSLDDFSGNGLFTGEELNNVAALTAKFNLTEKQMYKVLDAATEMAASGIMPLETAVENLSKTFTGDLSEMEKMVPSLKDLTEEQLANGKAVEELKKQYDGFRDSLSTTFEGQDKIFENAFGDLQSAIGTIFESVKLGTENNLLSPIKKATKWIEDHQIEILKFLFNLPDIIKEVAKAGWEYIKQTFSGEGLTNLFTFVGKVLLVSIINALKSAFAIVKALILSVGDLLNFILGNNIRKLQDMLANLGNSIIEDINSKIISLLNTPVVKGIYETFSKKKLEDFEGIKFRFDNTHSEKNKSWDETISGIGKSIKEAANTYTTGMKTTIAEEKALFKEWTGTYEETTNAAKNAIQNAMKQDLPKEVLTALSNASNAIEEIEEGVRNGITVDVNTSTDSTSTSETETSEAVVAAPEISFWQAILDGFKANLDGVFGTLGEIGMLMQYLTSASFNPITIIINLVMKFIQELSSASPVFNTFINSITYIIQIIVSAIVPMINTIFLPLINIIRNVGIMIGQLLIPVFNTLAKVLEPIFNLLGVLVQVSMPFIQVLAIFLNLLTELDPVLNLLASTVKFVADLITFLYNKVLRPVLNGMIWIFSKVGNFFIGLYNKIVDVLTNINILGWKPFKDMKKKQELSYDNMSLKEINTDSYDKQKEAIAAGKTPEIDIPKFNTGYDTNLDIKPSAPSYETTTGAAASYTAARDIIMNIEVGNVVGEDGLREFSLMIRDEIKAAEALGR